MFLKNRNISSKIKRSNVTDYAALKRSFSLAVPCAMIDSHLPSKFKDNDLILIPNQLTFASMLSLDADPGQGQNFFIS